MYYIIRAKKPISALNMLGDPADLVPGQRGTMLKADAVVAALRGDVDMLSPDGAADVALAPKTKSAEVSDGVQGLQETEEGRGQAPNAKLLKKPA